MITEKFETMLTEIVDQTKVRLEPLQKEAGMVAFDCQPQFESVVSEEDFSDALDVDINVFADGRAHGLYHYLSRSTTLWATSEGFIAYFAKGKFINIVRYDWYKSSVFTSDKLSAKYDADHAEWVAQQKK